MRATKTINGAAARGLAGALAGGVLAIAAFAAGAVAGAQEVPAGRPAEGTAVKPAGPTSRPAGILQRLRRSTTGPAATRPTTRPAAGAQAGEGAGEETERSGFTRIQPRAELTPAEYEAKAKALREAYAKPPAEWPKATIDEGVKYVEIGLPEAPVFPAENPYTEAKAELGRQLFFDPRLSGSGQIACASCHEAELGWSDGRTTSFGHGRAMLTRNSPTLNNIWARTSLFWDGRVKTLEDQVMMPIVAQDEMRSDPDEVVKRLAADPKYVRRFKAVFDDGADPAKADDAKAVTMERVAKAVATFERTIVSRTSAFDRFLKGKHDALSDSAVRGLHLFRTDARCANCHMGPTFSDEQFHNLGLTYYGRKLQDLGRYEVTKDARDVGAFKTPSLRNLPRTGPYMHNGLFDLDGVLRMYNVGMPNIRPKPEQKGDPLFPVKSPLLKPLALNGRDLEDLRAFLDSLQETRLRVRPAEWAD